MKGWIKYLNGTLAGLIAITSAASASCKPNETDSYAKKLNLPKEDRAIISQLAYDDNTKALLNEVSYLPGELQLSEEVLNYLKDISANKKVTNDEFAGFQDLDQDAIKNVDELKYGTDLLKPNPNVKYAIDKGLTAYIKEIKPLDENEEMDYVKEGLKKQLVEELYELSAEVRKDSRTISILENITQDGDVTNDELNRFIDLDQDGVSNRDELSVYQTDPLAAEKWDDFDTVTKILNTPEKISTWVGKNIKYRSEDVNEYVPASIVFERKYDDCDGFATIQAYFLRYHGYDAWNIGIGIEGLSGHNVAGYIVEGKYSVLDIGGIKRGAFNSWEDLADSYIRGASIRLFNPFDINSPTTDPFLLPNIIIRH